jgi:hypothetical protein
VGFNVTYTPGRDAAAVIHGETERRDVAMVPDELVRRWERAYRRYVEASKASMVAGDQQAARQMALASRQVAVIWQEIDARSDLPWWMAAAVSTAAQAFEFQARDWTARAELAWPVDNGSLGPQRRLPARLQPHPRRHGEGR